MNPYVIMMKKLHQRYQSYNRVLELEEGRGALFLGDVHAASSQRLLREGNIRTVVCCIKDYPMKAFKLKHAHIDVISLSMRDKPDQDITQYFPSMYATIEAGMQKGGVLVFCFAGVSRSASIVLSYLMQLRHEDYRSALSYLNTRRTVCPNKGFEEQLKAFGD